MTTSTTASPSAQALQAIRSVRRTHLVVGLFAAHVLLKLALLPTAVRAPLQGDEVTYNAGAKAMAAALRSWMSGNGLPTAGLQEHVVGFGWFMPGMSTLLTPLYIVAPDASVSAVRIYAGAMTLVLFAAALLFVFRVAPWQFAAALALVPGLVPLWVLNSFTIWGDLSAGIVLLAVVALMTHLWGQLSSTEGIRPRDAALLGALFGVTLYLRSSTLPLIGGLLVISTITLVVYTRGQKLLRSLALVGLAGVVLAAMILPWSYAASQKFDSRVSTTTTLPLSLAYAFGDRDELCLGPCPPGNIWYSMARYSQAVADRTGESSLAVQKRMSEHALRDVTISSYSSDVLDNFGRYVFDPTGFEAIFRTSGQGPDPAQHHIATPSPVSHFNVGVTKALYYGVLLLAALAILWVRAIPRRSQVVIILASLIAAALMTQPFVHVSSPRYWPVFLPMFTLLAASLAIPRDQASTSLVLRRVQIALAVAWLATPAALVGLSLL